MAARLPSLIFRLALLLALGVSAALLIDYLRPLPAFCDVGSGCDQVRLSRYGTLLMIPVPVIGLVGFATWMVLSLIPGQGAHFFARLLALVAGLTGGLLLVTQAFVIKVFCKLCVTVDIAAIVAATAALVSRPLDEVGPAGGRRGLWPVAKV